MSDRRCSVPGCGRKHSVHGLCRSHWSRVQKTGDVQADIPLRHYRPIGLSLSETFDYFMPGTPGTDCWEWTGSRNQAGYGVVRMTDSSFPAHRVSYELFIGPIPEGWCVCHRCDNPPCCHPDHLFLGTPADNTRDMMSKDRHVRGIVYGESCGTHKLSERDVLDIRRRYAERSSTQVELSAEYGISKNHTCAIIKRHAWQHLP